MIKFAAWALTQYPAVVLLDVVMLVLHPLDCLFDAMISHLLDPKDILPRDWTLPDRIDLLYFNDHPARLQITRYHPR